MKDIEMGAMVLAVLAFIITLPGWITAAVGWPIVHHWSWMLVAQGVCMFWCGLVCLVLVIGFLKMLGMSPLDELGVGSGERYGN